MALDARQLGARVLAELCLQRAFDAGKLGVFAEHIPAIDPQVFVSALGASAPRPLRVALLGGKDRSVKSPATITLTTDPTLANKWRNDQEARDGTPCVVLALGPAAKLNSLRTAVPLLGVQEFRQAIVERAVSLLSTPERRAFWSAVGERSGELTTAALLDFAAAVTEARSKSPAALLDREPREVHRLGLLPTKSLFTSSGVVAARRALRRNLDLMRRIKALPAKDRDRLVDSVEHGSAAEREAAEAILRFERTREYNDLAGLTLEDVELALRGRDSTTKPTADSDDDALEKEKARPVRVDGDALALELLLEHNGRGLSVASRRFKDAIEPDDEGGIEPEEVSVGRRKIQPRIKVGTTQCSGLFGRLLSEDVWGGLVFAKEGADFVAALKLVSSGDADIEEFRPAAKHSVRGTLKRAVDQGFAPSGALAAWDAYAAARTALLPSVTALIDHPLLAMAGDAKLEQRVIAVVEAYGRALKAIHATAEALKSTSVEASRRLLAHALCLDVAFIRTSSEFAAIAAPTHPFHLWRCSALLTVLRDHHVDLADVGLDSLEPLITDPPAIAPHLILSPFAVQAPLDRARPFIAVGSFGALPLFGEPTARQLGKFRARSLAKIADRLLRLMPHAALGLRVTLIDPQSIAGALEDLLDLASAFDDEEPVPIHATVLRTRAPRESTDEEDEAVAELARELRDAGGSLSVVPQTSSLREVSEYMAKAPTHLAVIFDPGDGQSVRISVAQPPALSPIALPRTYRYDAFEDRLDVVVAGDVAPFSTYHAIFCETLEIPRTDFVGRRSGASRSAEDLERIARHTVWIVVVDQAVEPTLRIGGAERLDWRTDGGRDLVTFTAHPETVEELIKDAVRAAGLAPDEDTVKRTLNQLFYLSGEAVLNLAKARPSVSLADARIAKGTIGVLAAARWHAETYPDAFLISLDDPASRRWILGAEEDNRHGDLLAVRSSQSGVIVEAIEVKAHDDEESGVKQHGGKIEGRAVTQVDQTLRILDSVLQPGAISPVTKARQDILRDQLYRAVASRPYSPDQRARFVRLLEELFTNGPAQILGLIFRVKIAPGAGSVRPSAPAFGKSPAGNEVGVVDLIESGPPGKIRSPAPKVPQSHAPPVKRGANADGVNAKQKVQSSAPVEPTPHPAPKAASPSKQVRVLIGSTAGHSEVYWDPHRADAPLNNFGFHITGDPGSGKTQMLRALIAAVSDCDLPICIFDYKNDYADPAFSNSLGLKVYDIDRTGLPFNPLSLVPDERGEAQPVRQIHELSAILRRIFGLGDQQEARLKRAMSAAYERYNIKPEMRHDVAKVSGTPTFSDVVSILNDGAKNEALLNRLSPLFDLNLFPEADRVTTTFERLLRERVVLDMHSLPDDRIKAAVSEFVIVRLHGYVLKGDQPRALRRLLVFDEAWRVKDSQRLQELAREGRAFGVGIAIGTQFPEDIHENLAGNLATQLLLQNQDPEHRRAVVRTLCGSSTGPAAQQLMAQVGQLQKHEGFFRNQQYAPYVLVQTLPHYKRQ